MKGLRNLVFLVTLLSGLMRASVPVSAHSGASLTWCQQHYSQCDCNIMGYGPPPWDETPWNISCANLECDSAEGFDMCETFKSACYDHCTSIANETEPYGCWILDSVPMPECAQYGDDCISSCSCDFFYWCS